MDKPAQEIAEAAAAQKVFAFGDGTADGEHSMKLLLGGKGADLAEMSRIGLPVPPGFTISTACCAYCSENAGAWPEGLDTDVRSGIEHIERLMQAGFGDADNPLLVSVRSGAAVSMPGMMDTVLNLGLNDQAVEGLARRSGNERFAYDAYRRFIDMFGNVVMGVRHDDFEEAMTALKEDRDVVEDVDLTGDDLKELVERYKAIYRQHTGSMFPDDPFEQLTLSINAVFGSWNSDRALKYRAINRIGGLIGTAVNVQAMVYGNMGSNSGTGVLFTRNPSTGEPKLYGEFLVDAQGEDVVAGIRTPETLERMSDHFPQAYEQLVATTQQLERHFQDMQDIEFTVQDGKLFLLQTRNGKRTGRAAVRIAVDMVQEGLADKEAAVGRLVKPQHIDQLLHPRFRSVEGYRSAGRVLASGLPASPGAAVGHVVFSAEDAEEAMADGTKTILVRHETSPEDVGGMHAAQGILTSRGGMTSHAAVVARGWGKPCIAGCGEIVIDYKAKTLTNGKVVVHEGDWISINGSTGEVVLGAEELVEPELAGDFAEFLSWVDEFRVMKVRANADSPVDAKAAREFGAQGIGLCRTEHMFFDGHRIRAVREMILADDLAGRRRALAKLLPYQKADFLGIFRAMEGLPVTVRLLDPPLHEFLPHGRAEQKEMAREMNVSVETVKTKVDALDEFNPMLGHRGCRLGISYPEITEMQTRAILEAAVELKQEGLEVRPEIMVPLIGTLAEFSDQKAVIRRTADAVFAERGMSIDYLVGTMIEIPRAALTADQIATEAEFFSFGTNDLTQMTFGYSRDDAGSFLPQYLEAKILPEDPFQSIDIDGVGQLVRLGTERGRSTCESLKVGICGEHGGDPASVTFCHQVGLDYVSCSPFRVPVARLAAAQAHLATQVDDD